MSFISSEKTIERLSLYRRVLMRLHEEGETVVFSRQLAIPAGVTPAQVRRDIMNLGCSGIPRSGYRIVALLTGITEVFDTPQSQRAILVGIGRLGLALLSHFSGRWRWLHIHAAFDRDPARQDSERVIAILWTSCRWWLERGVGIDYYGAPNAAQPWEQVCAAGDGPVNFTSTQRAADVLRMI